MSMIAAPGVGVEVIVYPPAMAVRMGMNALAAVSPEDLNPESQ